MIDKYRESVVVTVEYLVDAERLVGDKAGVDVEASAIQYMMLLERSIRAMYPDAHVYVGVDPQGEGDRVKVSVYGSYLATVDSSAMAAIQEVAAHAKTMKQWLVLKEEE